MSTLSLKKIGYLVNEGRKSHDFIVVMFKMWLTNNGVSEEKIMIQREMRGIQPDIVVLGEEGRIKSVWEIIEPDQNWNLRNKDVRKKLEVLIVKAYNHILAPEVSVLTDGISMLIYDQRGAVLTEINDLSKVEDDLEEKIKEIVL